METKTQIKTSNRNAYKYASNKEPFKANNLSGEIKYNSKDLSYYYVIYSYDWYPLFIYNFGTNRWYENKVKYSVTTSKQMTQVRPVFTAKEMTNEMFKQFRKY